MGLFTRRGLVDVPFVYSVRELRNGGVYCFRAVDARQNGDTCFSCICSFKHRELHPYGHQPRIDKRRYQGFLDKKQPTDHPIAPGLDAPWYVEQVEQGITQEWDFPGVEVRKVNMDEYNQTGNVRRNPHEYRQLQFYCLRGSPEGGDPIENGVEVEDKEQTGEYDNLYACAHLYASDKNSLFIIPRALGHADDFIAMGSLSCSVIFHEHGEALRMLNRAPPSDGEKPQKKWFLQEAWTSRSGDNRAMHESRLWTSDGVLLATTMQDSMIRYKTPERQKL
jgi:acyl-CoA thioesterase II